MSISEMFDRKNKGNCPFCNEDTKKEQFRDELSKKEQKISGLCQGCQDETFG